MDPVSTALPLGSHPKRVECVQCWKFSRRHSKLKTGFQIKTVFVEWGGGFMCFHSPQGSNGSIPSRGGVSNGMIQCIMLADVRSHVQNQCLV